jgi:TPR repeat protein
MSVATGCRRWGSGLAVALALLAQPLAGQARAQAPAWTPPPGAVVTECDRLAAHPEDPDRVAPGVPQAQVDTARAIAACQAAVAADPKNPRLNYQLARALGYAGRGREAGPYREAAVAGNYPQALFVVGFIHLFGLNDAERDPCKAADLIRRSADAGRLAGLIGYPAYLLTGRFAGCPADLPRAQLLGYLERARAMVGSDFYRGLLIDTLEAQLRARPS